MNSTALALTEHDALEQGLLPADPYWLAMSPDVPSSSGVRPFGLTRATVVPEEKIVVISGMTYDPVRQISVDADGVPEIHAAGPRNGTPCSQTTKEDGQTWTDNPIDD